MNVAGGTKRKKEKEKTRPSVDNLYIINDSEDFLLG
jgi:hypothetical protein